MCGITGWINWSGDLSTEQDTLKKMADSIAHRGPDEEGFWLSEQAALAHRRLIVIDPRGGKQPMTSSDQQLVLTYNGELYNYRELTQELKQKGHTFTSNSDTEVVLHAYMEWKEECVKHFNGIFAFAIWDKKEQQLFLGRDHLGVKPLFYSKQGDSLFYGSEMKAILAHPSVQPQVDRKGLAEVFGMGPMRTPGQAIFKGIDEVRPGHYVIATADSIEEHRYWKLESKPHTDDVDTTTETIRELLTDTVQRQLISDMPVVSMLSGGLDSSGLTSLAAQEFKQSDKTLGTYSIDFDQNEDHFQKDFLRHDMDEPWVKRVSDHVGTDHHSVTFGADQLLSNLLEPMRGRDLPGVGEIETSLYLLFKEMKKDATVALSGESADEVFSGYPWFHQEKYLDAEVYPWLVNLKGISSVLSEETKKQIQPEQYQKERFAEAYEEIPFLEGESEFEAKQRQMSYFFITRFLPFMLDRKDRASMKIGFEVRVPFCDYRIVEYLWNVPIDYKNVDDIEKGILRRALKGTLPDDVLYRKKSAYPSDKDPVYLEGVQNWMIGILDNPDSPILSLIDTKKVRAIASNEAEGLNTDQMKGLLDYLIQINAWLDEYDIELVS
ncbi:asparagine synthase (glutamine-hydrolyzing) [Alkalihalobacillus hwajinpoensis]|uniref:asparagine synthase (glutamine-hydrolyzing) n=1 Tax=Guptibacillus hwajinpoensis TaxID=208199 RepID=UPI0018845A47|nr:asparagine synthase (glutamine-hydrolyzing) [Pseudalkalibacillus hwajinpoensis]MBF0705464.1 asparagine synthase (glutamine-hydrolyzing) [Pseudalkalibacillus hwajinpoensis]